MTKNPRYPYLGFLVIFWFKKRAAKAENSGNFRLKNPGKIREKIPENFEKFRKFRENKFSEKINSQNPLKSEQQRPVLQISRPPIRVNMSNLRFKLQLQA